MNCHEYRRTQAETLSHILPANTEHFPANGARPAMRAAQPSSSNSSSSGGSEPRRGTQRFTVVEQRQVANVQRQRAGRRLLVDDDGHWTAFHALAECDAAATGKPRVRESFQHRPRSYHHRSALIVFSKSSFDPRPVCFMQILPVARNHDRDRHAENRSERVLHVVVVESLQRPGSSFSSG